MLDNILLGFLLVLLTTIVHAAATVGVIRVLKVKGAGELIYRSGWTRFLTLGGIVLFMFAASLFEAAMWAATHLWAGALTSFEEALYFSLVTFTTLGYGEITLDVPWRLLSALEAANGVLMLGWTTSIIVAAVQRLYVLGSVGSEIEEKLDE